MLTSGTAVITTGEYSFTIAVKALSHELDKQLMIFPFPTKGADDTRTILVDLQRCKEAVTINGYVNPINVSATDGSKTVTAGLTQISYLIDIMRKTKDIMTLKWGAQGTYETMLGSISKVDIKEEQGRMEGDTADPKVYSIQLVFVRGSEVR